jgi:hypothetical protein
MKWKLEKKDNNIYVSVKKYKFWFFRMVYIVWINFSDEFGFLNCFHEREAIHKAFNYISKKNKDAIILTQDGEKTVDECLEIYVDGFNL